MIISLLFFVHLEIRSLFGEDDDLNSYKAKKISLQFSLSISFFVILVMLTFMVGTSASVVDNIVYELYVLKQRQVSVLDTVFT